MTLLTDMRGGEPVKHRPWTLEGLACVALLAMAGCPNRMIGDETGRLAADVDLALWALVGRSPEQALERLQGGGTLADLVRAEVARAALIKRQLKETHA